MKKIIITGIILFSAVFSSVSASAGSKIIKATDYGDKWPLTVSKATLSCHGPGAVYIRANPVPLRPQQYYPVNGLASSQVWIDRYIGRGKKLSNLENIWAFDEKEMAKWGYEVRISIGPLIEDGLELCK
ncbi:MAG: DUF2511 domain-containing protein [Candidatus Dadabacteria bacterium]|nr:DUF2511 domain-containing protein [Candidatus Dadabacteria bacterium]MDE0476930.1 DUF2511 domain-containing protein [Candidatus Dadabacteria bacterium]